MTSSTSQVTECPYCKGRFPGRELLCECEAINYRFGGTSCADCGITYGLYWSLMEYIDEFESSELGMKMAYDCYGAKLKFNVPSPCRKCSQDYQAYHTLLTEDFETFKVSYDKRMAAEWFAKQRMEEWDDDPCTSGSGMCRCCGECPDGR